MLPSYGETSGFIPVESDELTTVNGGNPFVLGVVFGAVLAFIGYQVYQVATLPPDQK